MLLIYLIVLLLAPTLQNLWDVNIMHIKVLKLFWIFYYMCNFCHKGLRKYKKWWLNDSFVINFILFSSSIMYQC
jgi:hypothetical protein